MSEPLFNNLEMGIPIPYNEEILADTYYRLGINTLFFGILVNHIEEEHVSFCIDDFEKMRLQFVNTGRPIIHNAFTHQELIEFLYRLSTTPSGSIKYITNIDNYHYIANMKIILTDCEFTDEEKAFFNNDIRELKIFLLFCRLSLDMRLTNDTATVKLLRLNRFVR